MDPLSVMASIVGILAAAGKLSETLGSVTSTVTNAPQTIAALTCEINEIQAALSSLQVLLADLSSAQPHRAALIQLDQLIATLTEAVLTFSELETIISPLASPSPEKFPLRTRLKWAYNEGTCLKIVEKLQRHKSSISLMLNILQCASDADASRSQASLHALVEQLLANNEELYKRLKNLEDAFDAQSMVARSISGVGIASEDDDATIRTTRPSAANHTSILEAVGVRFAFEHDLESSRVYRMAKNDDCDRSFKSSAIRTNAWSIFSGLSLADISVISVVALPLHARDIGNREHYSLGAARSAHSSQLHSSEDSHIQTTATDTSRSIDSDIQSPFTGDGDYEIVRRNYWRKRFFDPVDAVLADLR